MPRRIFRVSNGQEVWIGEHRIRVRIPKGKGQRVEFIVNSPSKILIKRQTPVDKEANQ